MAERATSLALAIVAPGAAARFGLAVPAAAAAAIGLVLPFVPGIFIAATRREPRERERGFIERAAGFGVCALCYAAIGMIGLLTRV